MTDMEPITLRSEQLRCVLSPLGASVFSVYVRMPDGEERPVALMPVALLSGDSEPSLSGRCIAPGCGRIRGGVLRTPELTLALTPNEGENHLHGGPHAAQYRLWNVVSSSDTQAVFTITLEDGTDGYPGRRTVEVRYTLQGSSLRLDWEARTDAVTPFDLTNHVYWDLSGRFDGSALDQRLIGRTDRYVENDTSHLPVCLRRSAGTVFDMTAPETLRERMQRTPRDPQLENARGFNNALLTDGECLALLAPDCSLRMTLRTDRPCVVLYTGGYLDETTRLPGGAAVPGCAIALEAQGIPDAGRLGLEVELLRPGETMRHYISWSFEVIGGAI